MGIITLRLKLLQISDNPSKRKVLEYNLTPFSAAKPRKYFKLNDSLKFQERNIKWNEIFSYLCNSIQTLKNKIFTQKKTPWKCRTTSKSYRKFLFYYRKLYEWKFNRFLFVKIFKYIDDTSNWLENFCFRTWWLFLDFRWEGRVKYFWNFDRFEWHGICIFLLLFFYIFFLYL